LGSSVRALGGSAEIQSPAMGANFAFLNGTVKINFRGTAPADGDTAQYPLVLKIYDNRPTSGQPLFRLLPTITSRNATTGKWTFSLSPTLRLSPGLFYYTIERQADEDLIFVGKLTVGKQ
jgi:hypothetical protein